MRFTFQRIWTFVDTVFVLLDTCIAFDAAINSLLPTGFGLSRLACHAFSEAQPLDGKISPALPHETFNMQRAILKLHPEGPCTQTVYTLALKYSLCRDIGPKVYTIWVHGPLKPKPLWYPCRTHKGALKGSLFWHMDPYPQIPNPKP